MRKSVVLRSGIGAMMLAAAMMVPARAGAAVIIFDQVEQGGTITSLGGGQYSGSGIIFETVTYGSQTLYCGDLVDISPGNTPGAGTTDTNCSLDFNTSTGFF